MQRGEKGVELRGERSKGKEQIMEENAGGVDYTSDPDENDKFWSSWSTQISVIFRDL